MEIASPPNSNIPGLEHPFVRQTIIDKIRGTVIGAALGDCVGLYTEFLSKKQVVEAYGSNASFQLVEPATELRSDGHRDKFEKKAWTDDTDHSLLIILSYLHQEGKILPDDVASRLQSWVEQGLRCLERPPLGLGRTVGSVVTDKEYRQDPSGTAYSKWDNGNRQAAPNGSLMRTHPLGIICLNFSLEETFQIAAEYSLITHADPRCVIACCTVTGLIRGIIRGEILQEREVDEMIEKAVPWMGKWLGKWQENKENPRYTNYTFDEAELKHCVHAKDFRDLELDDGRKMGYVYKCLGSAILALRKGIRSAQYMGQGDVDCSSATAYLHVYEDVITELVMEGGDADTNACVAGGLLGSWLGFVALPCHWRDGIKHRDWLISKTDSVAQIVGVLIGSSHKYKGSEDPDTRPDGGRGFLNKEELEKMEMDLVHKLIIRQKERDEKAKGTGDTRWKWGKAGLAWKK